MVFLTILNNIFLNQLFENFLFNIDDYLENIIDKAESQDFDLDSSLESLNKLENYIINNNITINDDDYNDEDAEEFFQL